MLRFSKFKQFGKHNDIFSKISGYQDIKWLLTSALNSEEPVHILLVGKPGLGKTVFLDAIEREYENSYMALGSGSTAAGMINTCSERKPRFLLVSKTRPCAMCNRNLQFYPKGK